MTPARPAAPRGNPRKWLRRLHAWCGMALAGMLLLFALTGFLLNHRALMKIPALDKQEVARVLPLPARPPDPAALAAQVAAPLGVDAGAFKPRIEAERTLEWDGRTVVQPARWTLTADTPSQSIRVEYWAGSNQAEARLTRPNLWLYLARLHMAIGTGPAWVLFSDAVALGLAALALSGFWMWGRLHGQPRRLATLAAGGAALAGLLAWLAG
ncbi:MAG: PepSY-associated TM helix domain-containing protein [Rhodocyclales bacterium]|nr:PepSY-associated TM helix domain-containing protein [Rhodocyclales bacterium]